MSADNRKAVLISCFDWYRSRLEPIREVLIGNGYTVTVLTADFDHGTKTPINESRRRSECHYIHVPEYKKNISLNRIYSHICFGRKAAGLINRIKPDIVYLLLPPNYTARFCERYKKKNPQTVLIVDLIDLWPENMPVAKLKKTPPVRIWRKWRDDCIRIADHVFTECDFYQKRLSYVLDPEITSTQHLFKSQPESEKTLVRSHIDRKNRDDRTVRFAYLGSMNNIIDIDGICRVIKDVREMGYDVELHAIGDGESKTAFENAVKGVSCSTYFYGRTFDEEKKINILAPCDMAFNMMKSTVEVGLTIKSIDYFSYGLPLINNIKGDTWRFVKNEDLGICIKDKGITGKQLEHVLKIPRVRIVDFYEQHFDRHTFVENFSSVFKKLTEKTDAVREKE